MIVFSRVSKGSLRCLGGLLQVLTAERRQQTSQRQTINCHARSHVSERRAKLARVRISRWLIRHLAMPLRNDLAARNSPDGDLLVYLCLPSSFSSKTSC